MDHTRLNVHAINANSQANGPGIRYTLWLQGCSIHCDGCFNPGTHDPLAGTWMSILDILQDIQNHMPNLDGITVTGGEPLDQAAALSSFLSACRDNLPLPILLFTGYNEEQIAADPSMVHILNLIDVLVCGPYRQKEKNTAGFPGSKNQKIQFITDTYAQNDFVNLPPAEITIHPAGDVDSSGTDPFRLFL
jgi:anaerobic ribonucleoside-triphosphate reductase activating protein